MKQHRTKTRTPAFSIEARITQDVAEISLRGDADVSVQRQLLEWLAATRRTAARELCLELSELDFCDCTIAGELVAFADEARAHDQRVTVIAANPWIWTILALVDVGGSLNLTADAVMPSAAGDGVSVMTSAPVLRIIDGVLAIDGHTDGV